MWWVSAYCFYIATPPFAASLSCGSVPFVSREGEADSQCPKDDYNHGNWSVKIAEWDEIFMKDARKRLQKDMKGYELTIRDVEDMVRWGRFFGRFTPGGMWL